MRLATAPKHRVRPDSGRIRARIFPASTVEEVRAHNCCFARTLAILFDAWTLLVECPAWFGARQFEIADTGTSRVIRETSLGVRRFDRTLSELMVAPNILADRLNRPIDRGVFKRWMCQDLPEPPEPHRYHLTEAGKGRYGALVVMMAWGDRWLHMAGRRCSRRKALAAGITPPASSAKDAASRSLPTLHCASGTIAVAALLPGCI